MLEIPLETVQLPCFGSYSAHAPGGEAIIARREGIVTDQMRVVGTAIDILGEIHFGRKPVGRWKDRHSGIGPPNRSCPPHCKFLSFTSRCSSRIGAHTGSGLGVILSIQKLVKI